MDDNHVDPVEQASRELYAAHAQILQQSDFFRRAAATYYFVCDILLGQVPVEGDERWLAFWELMKLGVLNVDPNLSDQLAVRYVSALRQLKQAVDTAVAICDGLEVRSAASTEIAESSPLEVRQENTLRSLGEALEEETLGG